MKIHSRISQPQRQVLKTLELLGKLDARDVTATERKTLNALVKHGFVQEITVVQRFGRNEIFYKLSVDYIPEKTDVSLSLTE